MTSIFYFIRRIRSPRGLVLFLAVLAMCLIGMSRASAQEHSGAITGVVTDPIGAVIVGATIYATNIKATDVDWRFTYGATSDERGRYSLQNLPAGRYSIRFQATGFKDAELSVLTVAPDQTAEIDITLFPAASITCGPCGELLLPTENVRVGGTIPLLPLEPLPTPRKRHRRNWL